MSCTGSEVRTNNNLSNNQKRESISSSILPDGKYPVQQASYDDADGVYSLMLLNTPSGDSPNFRTQRLQMARLSDQQTKDNVKTFLDISHQEPILYLSEDFKIEYVHAVTQATTNPQTGERQEIVVRRESSAWSPFLGALAGQAIGNALFQPRYYVPPMYQGSSMRGFGGYGNSYNSAVENYSNRYNQPPASVRNRQVLRSSGGFGSSSFGSKYSNKSSGSGFSSSRLSSYGRNSSFNRSSFGSSSGMRRSSFGSFSGRRR